MYFAVVPQWNDIQYIEAPGEPAPPAGFQFTHWPTEQRSVNQFFGVNPEHYEPYRLPGHDGVDVKAPAGSKIFCVAAGTVHSIHTDPAAHNYGIHVRVDHAGGYQTIYAHLAGVAAGVVAGAAVADGQELGKADATGNATGAHLA